MMRRFTSTTICGKLCANLMCGYRKAIDEARFGKDKRTRAQRNQRSTGGMAMTDPGYYAGGDVRIWKVHHGWRDDQGPRLWATTRGAVIDATKTLIAAMERLPMRNTKW